MRLRVALALLLCLLPLAGMGIGGAGASPARSTGIFTDLTFSGYGGTWSGSGCDSPGDGGIDCHTPGSAVQSATATATGALTLSISHVGVSAGGGISAGVQGPGSENVYKDWTATGGADSISIPCVHTGDALTLTVAGEGTGGIGGTIYLTAAAIDPTAGCTDPTPTPPASATAPATATPAATVDIHNRPYQCGDPSFPLINCNMTGGGSFLPYGAANSPQWSQFGRAGSLSCVNDSGQPARYNADDQPDAAWIVGNANGLGCQQGVTVPAAGVLHITINTNVASSAEDLAGVEVTTAAGTISVNPPSHVESADLVVGHVPAGDATFILAAHNTVVVLIRAWVVPDLSPTDATATAQAGQTATAALFTATPTPTIDSAAATGTAAANLTASVPPTATPTLTAVPTATVPATWTAVPFPSGTPDLVQCANIICECIQAAANIIKGAQDGTTQAADGISTAVAGAGDRTTTAVGGVSTAIANATGPLATPLAGLANSAATAVAVGNRGVDGIDSLTAAVATGLPSGALAALPGSVGGVATGVAALGAPVDAVATGVAGLPAGMQGAAATVAAPLTSGVQAVQTATGVQVAALGRIDALGTYVDGEVTTGEQTFVSLEGTPIALLSAAISAPAATVTAGEQSIRDQDQRIADELAVGGECLGVSLPLFGQPCLPHASVADELGVIDGEIAGVDGALVGLDAEVGGLATAAWVQTLLGGVSDLTNIYTALKGTGDDLSTLNTSIQDGARTTDDVLAGMPISATEALSRTVVALLVPSDPSAAFLPVKSALDAKLPAYTIPRMDGIHPACTDAHIVGIPLPLCAYELQLQTFTQAISVVLATWTFLMLATSGWERFFTRGKR